MTHPNRKYPRAEFHDYNGGEYFVTVCTKNFAHYLGEIRENRMINTPIGDFLEDNINNIYKHFADVEIPQYVIMPNHFHLVVSIKGEPEKSCSTNLGVLNKKARLAVATGRDPTFDTHYNNKLGIVVGSIKAAATRFAHANGLELVWLPRFNDHIIRGFHDGNLIHRYIQNNVAQWDIDKFYTPE